MAHEIERKFLVKSDGWRAAAEDPSGVVMRQGYIAAAAGRTVRIRVAGARAFLTIKGPADPSGVWRDEYEYEIPRRDAEEMLARLCEPPLIEKTRYRVQAVSRDSTLVWEVDVFAGENAGLVVAEVELSAADQAFEMPAWVGEEVTADARYRNSALVSLPWTKWVR